MANKIIRNPRGIVHLDTTMQGEIADAYNQQVDDLCVVGVGYGTIHILANAEERVTDIGGTIFHFLGDAIVLPPGDAQYDIVVNNAGACSAIVVGTAAATEMVLARVVVVNGIAREIHDKRPAFVKSGAGGGAGGHIIADEGAPLAAEPVLNFIGPHTQASDNAGTSSDVYTWGEYNIICVIDGTIGEDCDVSSVTVLPAIVGDGDRVSVADPNVVGEAITAPLPFGSEVLPLSHVSIHGLGKPTIRMQDYVDPGGLPYVNGYPALHFRACSYMDIRGLKVTMSDVTEPTTVFDVSPYIGYLFGNGCKMNVDQCDFLGDGTDWSTSLASIPFAVDGTAEAAALGIEMNFTNMRAESVGHGLLGDRISCPFAGMDGFVYAVGDMGVTDQYVHATVDNTTASDIVHGIISTGGDTASQFNSQLTQAASWVHIDNVHAVNTLYGLDPATDADLSLSITKTSMSNITEIPFVYSGANPYQNSRSEIENNCKINNYTIETDQFIPRYNYSGNIGPKFEFVGTKSIVTASTVLNCRFSPASTNCEFSDGINIHPLMCDEGAVDSTIGMIIDGNGSKFMDNSVIGAMGDEVQATVGITIGFGAEVSYCTVIGNTGYSGNDTAGVLLNDAITNEWFVGTDPTGGFGVFQCTINSNNSTNLGTLSLVRLSVLFNGSSQDNTAVGNMANTVATCPAAGSVLEVGAGAINNRYVAGAVGGANYLNY